LPRESRISRAWMISMKLMGLLFPVKVAELISAPSPVAHGGISRQV
jgi:hypothetical protein